jgi:hypothetical protein
MMPIQCATCVHYVDDNKCLAFPDGIPDVILTGEIDHDRPMMDQVGSFVWTEAKEKGK